MCGLSKENVDDEGGAGRQIFKWWKEKAMFGLVFY